MIATINPEILEMIQHCSKHEPPYKYVRFTRNAPSNKEYDELLGAYMAVCSSLDIIGRLSIAREEKIACLEMEIEQLNMKENYD